MGFLSYPLRQHCHLNDTRADYSCEKTKRQPAHIVVRACYWHAYVCKSHVLRHYGLREVFARIVCQV